jgi:hypothetical protein
MNTLTKNRIIEKGDEFLDGDKWKLVPQDDVGLQIEFSKYASVRRPAEKPFKQISPEATSATRSATGATKAEKVKTPAPTPSGAGETPHATSYLPTVVSRRAHSSGVTVAKTGLIEKIKETLRETPETAKDAPTEVAKSPASPTPPIGVTAPSPAKVTWPANEPDCQWIGRNGTFKCRGVNIYRHGKGIIKIVPVGKRGVAKNAEIEFPVNAIPQVIEFLKKQL